VLLFAGRESEWEDACLEVLHRRLLFTESFLDETELHLGQLCSEQSPVAADVTLMGTELGQIIVEHGRHPDGLA
jgi:hypothetical protein